MLTLIQVEPTNVYYKAALQLGLDGYSGIKIRAIPKLPEDEDAEFRPDARTRRNMMRMVIPFPSVTTQCSLSGESPEGQDDKR
jgi:hypothetical protein